jgi:hypothetical protein
MALPVGWPPRPASGLRSIRYYLVGTATANFVDNAFLFADQATANTYKPLPYVPPGGEGVTVALGDLAVSGSPMGGGADPHDAISDPRYGPPVPVPHPMLWCRVLRITSTSGALEFSFDGVVVHGRVGAGLTVTYQERFEAGVALRGAGAGFVIEAW